MRTIGTTRRIKRVVVAFVAALALLAFASVHAQTATRVGTLTQPLDDEGKKAGWIMINMNDDWKRVFAFESFGSSRPR